MNIPNKYGLHARPAMQLVELANAYNCKIEVSNTTLTVDAKSIMSVMRLGAAQGTVLRIVADGSDCEEAVDALCELVESGFGEMDGPPSAAGDGAPSPAPSDNHTEPGQ